ncbi:mitochondrial 2-enoyl thioester reductase [Scheffersomyces stipitis CBS 6054]|uniref:Mitochondrial 2-enoyl thioester reductase n=1 Tax=Scheffersomyces stipitis (strain ATCC 58785 / CBS 6054 / NBRC 10063 / NRRL Y-11545) TaxID=322104 RepID=A3GHQ8_PICST|nr:mitochondrial 2-enoyl thioester reductase [Scheffersomyces stipitis CBS 6054]EAZ62863.2 mitochondrial 2-enoyl thioester reductase [Scheffersomyces stipitis CBS 6054]KAG2734944.1 hypothetical protein G9P44_001158 [Scheffersomyces stipitis]
MSIQAQAVTFTDFGKDLPNVLKQTKFVIDPANLKSNQLVLKALANSVNPSDIHEIFGGYRIPRTQYLNPDEPLYVGGNEGVFRVVEVGSDVKFKKGDWLIAKLPGFGTWRSYALATIEADDPEPFIKISSDDDDSLSVEQAATISINPPTALQLLNQFVKDWADDGNDWVIQNAGNSSVSKFVTQLAKLKNVKTISIVRDGKSDEEIKELQDFHATKVLTESEFLAEDFLSKTLPALIGPKGKVRLALNSIGGGEAVTQLANSLSHDGFLVTFGVIGGGQISIDPRIQLFKNITTAAYWLTANTKKNPQSKVDTVQTLLEYYKQGKIVDTPLNKIQFKENENIQKVFVNAIVNSKDGKQVIFYE